MGGKCSVMGEIRNAYTFFVEKFEGKRPCGRPRRRWDDNIDYGRSHTVEVIMQ